MKVIVMGPLLTVAQPHLQQSLCSGIKPDQLVRWTINQSTNQKATLSNSLSHSVSEDGGKRYRVRDVGCHFPAEKRTKLEERRGDEEEEGD